MNVSFGRPNDRRYRHGVSIAASGFAGRFGRLENLARLKKPLFKRRILPTPKPTIDCPPGMVAFRDPRTGWQCNPKPSTELEAQARLNPLRFPILVRARPSPSGADFRRRFPISVITPVGDPLINEAKVAAPGAGVRPAAPIACPTCATQVDRSLETPMAFAPRAALTTTTPSEQRTFDMKGIGLIVLLVGGVIGLKILKVF